jgi:hypothetical protein
MDLSRIRRGETIAAAGGLVLLIALLFFDWYSRASVLPIVTGETDFGAWEDVGFFGAIANLVILAAGVAAVGLAIVTVTSRTIALPVAASALTATLGIGAVAMVLLRMLFQPGPNGLTDLKFGIVLALFGALVVAYGGWESMREEGTTFDEARDQLQARYARSSDPREAPPPAADVEPTEPLPPAEPQPPPAEPQPPPAEPQPPETESRPPPGP